MSVAVDLSPEEPISPVTANLEKSFLILSSAYRGLDIVIPLLGSYNPLEENVLSPNREVTKCCVCKTLGFHCQLQFK